MIRMFYFFESSRFVFHYLKNKIIYIFIYKEKSNTVLCSRFGGREKVERSW